MKFAKALFSSFLFLLIFTTSVSACTFTVAPNPPFNTNQDITFSFQVQGTICDHGDNGLYELEIHTNTYDSANIFNQPNLDYVVGYGEISNETVDLSHVLNPGSRINDVNELCVRLLWNNAPQSSYSCFPIQTTSNTTESCNFRVYSSPNGDMTFGETLHFSISADSLNTNARYELNFIAHGDTPNPTPVLFPANITNYDNVLHSLSSTIFGISSDGEFHEAYIRRQRAGATTPPIICETSFQVYSPDTSPYSYSPCSGITDTDRLADCETCTAPSRDGVPQGTYTAIGCIPTEPQAFVKVMLKWGISVGSGIAFLLIIFGAFNVITATGDPEKVNAGKETITSAITGLLFIIFAVFLLRFIGFDLLQIPGFS